MCARVLGAILLATLALVLSACESTSGRTHGPDQDQTRYSSSQQGFYSDYPYQIPNSGPNQQP